MVYEQKSSVNLHCAYFKQSEWGLKNCQPIRVLKTIIIAFLLAVTTIYAPQAYANQKPIIESFTFNPNEIDIVLGETKINFELIVSHPSGIANLSTVVTLTNSSTSNFSTYLTRIDSPVNYALDKVVFKGALVIPRSIEPGIFKIKADSISKNDFQNFFNTSDAIIS